MVTRTVKRSRARRIGESAYGLLLLGKLLVFAAVVLVVLASGAWMSWSWGQGAWASGREQGAMRVVSCDDSVCSGPFTPSGAGSPRARVTIDKSVTKRTGETIDVWVVPGSDEVVRTGLPGIAHALVPFAGALLLAAPVIAAGLRLRRVAWGAVAAGAALLVAAFALG
ncbi:hypothetical protein [Streptantibioticus ferralitis]|uniref:DUF3592 domain-containing protein n=1 Tax=Streptantibioticus ferralitis TaxID=236510 RepID=A0ABT5Z928_9ACTN|nr:hypothetical protein [Streptantibioticus ferralitis]MDF2260314.1 hypothetical protein [Streptantibioticus ferralitis]